MPIAIASRARSGGDRSGRARRSRWVRRERADGERAGGPTTADVYNEHQGAPARAGTPRLPPPFCAPGTAPGPGERRARAGRFVLLGGLDAADTSSAGIELANLRSPLRSYALPIAQHDAQGAALDGKVYVFGGGSFSELDHILRFDPGTGAVDQVGQLPHAQSDVAVAELDGTAYIVGGFDGINWFNTILAWRPGFAVRVAGHLPVGLRYSAVTAADGRLLVIGGSTPTGASEAIYSFDPATGRVRRIGRLPHPITHGARRRWARACTWSAGAVTSTTPRPRGSGRSIR